ncbi:MAG: PKD domain-containing protein, partial [Thermoplasmata archaeon]|nr:PKD domain-containing protein [Thermoplasmata archaeon]
KTALVAELVEFTATATDPNGDVLVYTWDFGDDSDVVVGQTVEHAYDAADEYTFTVYVDDGEFNETASATITVNASDPPVANAGADQTVEAGDDVSFDGSDSTDDVDVVNYTWAFTYSGSAVTLYGVSPEHTFEVAGEYNVTLTVKDAENQTGTDYVLITVEEIVDDGKSWIDTYGLPLGIIVALIVAAMVAVLVMKGRKGGKAAESAEMGGPTSEVPEDIPSDEPPLPPAEGQ